MHCVLMYSGSERTNSFPEFGQRKAGTGRRKYDCSFEQELSCRLAVACLHAISIAHVHLPKFGADMLTKALA